MLMLVDQITNLEMRERALTHKSYRNEKGSSVEDNERLEYLGDAVLDLILSDVLYRLFANVDEGHLSKYRASLVNESVLADLALKQQLHEQIRLGKGEKSSGGDKKPRILSSTLEAVIGALYLEKGYDETKKLVHDLFAELIRENPDNPFESDYKTRLQEIVQERHKRTPAYELVSESGPDHDKMFFVKLVIDQKVISEGAGKSKKQAEQEAARKALEIL